jgi:hypothetical protein
MFFFDNVLLSISVLVMELGLGSRGGRIGCLKIYVMFITIISIKHCKFYLDFLGEDVFFVKTIWTCWDPFFMY